MTLNLTHATITAAALCLGASSLAAGQAGYTAFGVEAPHHGRGMIGAIWYPAAEDGRAFTFAENPVFHGVQVVEEASVLDGPHPVVLLSHGMGGNIRSLAWLASDLAEGGAIVVSVNHPNSTWGDFDLAKGLEHWSRVADLSLALDTLLADPLFAGQLDTSRVMAAGFSYGGWSALSMGGLRGDHAGYVAHCESYGAASSHCDDLMRADVGLQGVDSARWDQSYADARITHVMAIDPGLTWGLDAQDTVDLIPQVHLIGLGAGEDRMVATDFDGSGFAQLLPNATVDRLVPAVHFSALPLCKPMGAAILREEQDDPVCTDPEGANRVEVHDMIVQAILSDLNL